MKLVHKGYQVSQILWRKFQVTKSRSKVILGQYVRIKNKNQICYFFMFHKSY